MKNKELKVMYFERGAAALRNVKPVNQECYCCPLCARLYPRDALDLGRLTLEHAPPRRVGGKPIALTCKKCNSVSGYSVDCEIVERERLRDFTRAFTEEKQDYKGRATLPIPLIPPCDSDGSRHRVPGEAAIPSERSDAGVWCFA